MFETCLSIYKWLTAIWLNMLGGHELWGAFLFAAGVGFVLAYVFTLATILTCHLEEMSDGGG